MINANNLIKMNRRAVIKNLALVIGSAILLPSCLKNDGTPVVALKHLNINSDQENLIGDVCETIIPKTNTPGAKDLNVHLFVLKMLDDCYTKKDQKTICERDWLSLIALVTKKI